jgi:hypothetical protein
MLVVAVVGSAVALWAYSRASSPPAPRTLQGTLVAKVVFDTPTEAWVSTSGMRVLFADGASYRLADYGVDGGQSSLPVDAVSVLDDHLVYELPGPPPALVIDQLEYTVVDGTYVGGDCYWCKVPYPLQPVVANKKNGTWKLTLGDTVVAVNQPDGWDGRPPDSGRADEGGVVIVARLDDERTAVVDVGGTCVIEGSWAWVSADVDGLLLHRVDPGQLDYTVERFPRCT